MAITHFRHQDLCDQLAARFDHSPFWTDTDLTDAVNDALALTNLLCGFWKAPSTQLTKARAWDYPLDAMILLTTRVSVDGWPLTETGLFDLDNGRPGWMAETTASGGDVPTRPTLWAPIDLQSIAIWPADAVGGATLLVDGVADTPFLGLPDSGVDLDDDLLDAVLDCAQHTAAWKEGSERFAATRPLFLAFLQRCGEVNQALKKSAVYRRLLGLDRQRDFRSTQGGANALGPIVAAEAQP